jgi:hypothetical protein
MQVATSESCLRCGASMEWRHQTWQCPRCRFKLGCCEGELVDCRPQGVDRPASESRADVSARGFVA